MIRGEGSVGTGGVAAAPGAAARVASGGGPPALDDRLAAGAADSQGQTGTKSIDDRSGRLAQLTGIGT